MEACVHRVLSQIVSGPLFQRAGVPRTTCGGDDMDQSTSSTHDASALSQKSGSASNVARLSCFSRLARNTRGVSVRASVRTKLQRADDISMEQRVHTGRAAMFVNAMATGLSGSLIPRLVDGKSSWSTGSSWLNIWGASSQRMKPFITRMATGPTTALRISSYGLVVMDVGNPRRTVRPAPALARPIVIQDQEGRGSGLSNGMN